jgi:hypothetical protein
MRSSATHAKSSGSPASPPLSYPFRNYVFVRRFAPHLTVDVMFIGVSRSAALACAHSVTVSKREP